MNQEGYCILLASIAMSFCESRGECLGYSETAHPGWNQLYPGGWLVGGGELLPSDDWVSCVKGQAASFYVGTLSVVGFQGSCGSLNGLYNYQGTTFLGSPYFNSGSRILYHGPYCNGDGAPARWVIISDDATFNASRQFDLDSDAACLMHNGHRRIPHDGHTAMEFSYNSAIGYRPCGSVDDGVI